MNQDLDIKTQFIASFVVAILFIFVFHVITGFLFDPKHQIFVLINIVMVACFISIFFFTIGSRIEEQILEKQIDNVVGDLISGADIIIPSETLGYLKTALGNVKIRDKNADKNAAESNSVLIKKAMVTISTLVIVSVAYIYRLSQKEDVSVVPILIDSSIILFFVGLTEFLFLSYLGSNFRSGDPNIVKRAILTAIDETPLFDNSSDYENIGKQFSDNIGKQFSDKVKNVKFADYINYEDYIR